MNRQLIAWRGIAATIMVLVHTVLMTTVYPHRWGFTTLTGWSNTVAACLSLFSMYVVPVFLFVSGAFFAYATRVQPGKYPIRLIWTNLSHILPPYLIWSIVFYLLIYLTDGTTFTFPIYIKAILVGYPFDFVPLLVAWILVSPLIARANKPVALSLLAAIGIYQVILINLQTPGIVGVTFPAWMEIFTPKVIGGTMTLYGIYFPMGLVFSRYAKEFYPWLSKFRILLLALNGILLAADIAGTLALWHAPWWLPYACPLLLMFLLPLIQRDQIPFFHFMEKVGVHSYGIYLTNLIILDLLLNLLKQTAPWLLNQSLPLILALAVITLGIQLLVMQGMKKWHLNRPIAWYLRKGSLKPG